MTHEEAATIQLLMNENGLNYRRLAQWWCSLKGAPLPQDPGEFGQVLCGEAELVLGMPVGSFKDEMRDLDTFEDF